MTNALSATGQADLSGRICIVTGAAAGIGKEIARGLAFLGATVLIAGRHHAQGAAAAAEVSGGIENGTALPMLLDLASQESIRCFADSFTNRYSRLDVLVNNAGVWQPQRHLSVDGLELTWAVNVAGPHLLMSLLEPSLQASAHARVVNVASTMAGGLDQDDTEFRRRRYNGIAAYKQSKQALRMLSWKFARRLEGSGVAVNAAHPGFTSTRIARNTSGLGGSLTRAFFYLCGKTPCEGADTPVWLAASAEAEGFSERFWANRCERPCCYRDPTAQEQLWEVLCRQNGLDPTC